MSFEYDRSWLKYPQRFAIDPALNLTSQIHHSNDRPLFGALDDSAPDRWGRSLMRRNERRLAKNENRRPRSLMEIDYLMLVDDQARQGALRFQIEDGENFLTTYEKDPIPPLVKIGKLLLASNHVFLDKESDEDLRLLLAPGSSLGGARPKACVKDKDGHLAIAKFPKKDDEYDLILWEALALTLANDAKILTPEWRLEKVAKKNILISRRFDRKNNIRIPFLSAMNAIGAIDNEKHSYLEIADKIRQISFNPKGDLQDLWKRIIFNILISNVDDHLRNHAFLYSDSNGWSLSPAYDLNPTPTDISPRILATAIGLEEDEAALETALSVAHYFDIGQLNAMEMIRQVGKITSNWYTYALKLKIKKNEIDRMSSAFEHYDQIFVRKIL